MKWMSTIYLRNACFFIHPVVKTATGISPLHHCRGIAAGFLWRSSTQQQEPRGLWDNTRNHITFNSGTMTQPPLGLPRCWCLFSQLPPFPEPIWGFLHMKAKANFRSSGLLKVTELTSQGARLLRVLVVQSTTTDWCQIQVNERGTITYSHYEHSLEVCVWSGTRITYDTVSKQEGRVIRTRWLSQRKHHFQMQEHFTQTPSAHLLF